MRTHMYLGRRLANCVHGTVACLFLSIAVSTVSAQVTKAGTSRLADILKDAESAAGLMASGRLLYNSDDIQRTWGQYCGQSQALANRGEFRQAVREASKALFLGNFGGGGVSAVAYASRDLAHAYSLAGDLDRAKEWADKSIATVTAGGVQSRGGVENEILAPVHKVLGDVAMRQGDIEEAVRQYELAQRVISIFASDRTPLQIAIANTDIKRGHFEAARKRLDELGSGSNWSALLARARGQLAFGEKKFDLAIEHYSKAAELMKGDKDPYHRMWMFYGLALSLRDAGKQETALTSLNEALAIAKGLRSRFRTAEFRAGFFGDIQDIYDEAIGLLFDAKRADEALAVSEESRARTLLDVLKGQGKAEKLDSSAAIAGVPAHTAVAVYHVLRDRTLVWTIRTGTVTNAAIPVGRQVLSAMVSRFRSAIVSRAPDTRAQGAKLYEILIQPLALKQGEVLVSVPHRSLHYLPVQALSNPLGAQNYLIEERGVATAPSLNAMLAITQSTESGRSTMLALGNPDLDNPDYALLGAELEVKEINAVFPAAQVYVRRAASKSRFLSSAPGNNLIHVAAHATVDEIDPSYSAIKLAKDKLPRGDLEAHEVIKMNLSAARLVTISACESGLGKVADGDEFYGFKRAFLAAGARSLLLSLWPVEDDSTATLMTTFYRNFRDIPMFEALRQAQISLIKVTETSDPIFWAPFILVGDWR